MTVLKIFGLRRSGTNYLASLLKNNFTDDILLHVGASKHDLPLNLSKEMIEKWIEKRKKEDNLFSEEHFRNEAQMNRVLNSEIQSIYIYKDIFSWLLSYLKYSRYNYSHPTEPPIKISDFDDLNIGKLIKKYKDYLKKANSRCQQTIKYNNLIENPFKTLKELEKKYKLTRKYPDLQDNPHMIDAGYSQSNQPFNKDFYLQKQYLNYFTKEQIKKITQYISV